MGHSGYLEAKLLYLYIEQTQNGFTSKGSYVCVANPLVGVLWVSLQSTRKIGSPAPLPPHKNNQATHNEISTHIQTNSLDSMCYTHKAPVVGSQRRGGL